MSLFIALGTNLGDRITHLISAQEELAKHFTLIRASRIYLSPAVDYTAQPDFYNQVLEFETPKKSPIETMQLLLSLEDKLGRVRDEKSFVKGPRTIDLDLLFYDLLVIDEKILTLPHPRLFERSFVVLPLKELPGFQELKKYYTFPDQFTNSATPIS